MHRYMYMYTQYMYKREPEQSANKETMLRSRRTLRTCTCTVSAVQIPKVPTSTMYTNYILTMLKGHCLLIALISTDVTPPLLVNFSCLTLLSKEPDISKIILNYDICDILEHVSYVASVCGTGEVRVDLLQFLLVIQSLKPLLDVLACVLV